MNDVFDFSSIQCEGDEQPSFPEDNPAYTAALPEDEVSVCAKNVFKVASLFPWQRLAISNILDGVAESSEGKMPLLHENCSADGFLATNTPEPEKETTDKTALSKQIILLPTGAGKSLCFQVPALILPTPTLVVYPLLALMSDQVRRLREAGIEPVLLRGEQTDEERSEALRRLEYFADSENGVKIIIANPEILRSEAILARLEKMEISHLAIDEAHCVSEWGDSFRPSYLKLREVIERIKPKAITAFTATASPEVLSRISEILFDGKAHVVRGETDRPNIYYKVKKSRVKEPALLEVLESVEKPLVIFASTRNRTERIANFLRYTLPHEAVRFYHAGLSRQEKEAAEKWFNAADDGILTATCAWGMGVDKKNIRTVIHFDAPQTVEAYVQEAGRGGRDGQASKAILLWSTEDRERLLSLKGTALSRAKHIIEYAEATTCRRRILLKTLGDVNACSSYAEMREVHCAGCDVCDKSAEEEAKDEKAFLRFLGKAKKVFTRANVVDYLMERNKRWRASDVNTLIRLLKAEGKIKECASPFWRGRIRSS